MDDRECMDDSCPDLDDLRDRILRFCSPKQILLFGSRANVTQRPDSDVDLLVVWDEKTHLKPSLRQQMLRRNIGPLPYSLDMLVYTSEELDNALADPLSFTHQALKGAKVIYS